MPSNNSVKTKAEKESKFTPVEKAKKVYREIFFLCLDLPIKYKYIYTMSINGLASDVMDYTQKANKVFINYKEKDPDEMRRRLIYWMQAKESLQALSAKIDFLLYIVPIENDSNEEKQRKQKNASGISKNRLEMIVDLIIEEQEELTKVIKNERRNYINAKNKQTNK